VTWLLAGIEDSTHAEAIGTADRRNVHEYLTPDAVAGI
jgi:hypothetical protein